MVTTVLTVLVIIALLIGFGFGIKAIIQATHPSQTNSIEEGPSQVEPVEGDPSQAELVENIFIPVEDGPSLFLDEIDTSTIMDNVQKDILTFIKECSTRHCPKLPTNKISGGDTMLCLNRGQILYILSNLFLGKTLNLNRKLKSLNNWKKNSVNQKKCLLSYFEVMKQEYDLSNKDQAVFTDYCVLYLHKKITGEISDIIKQNSKKKMSDIVIKSGSNQENNHIIDCSSCTRINCAASDFGGSILMDAPPGAQEESLMVLYPECLIAMIISDDMTKDSSISIIGCRRYTNYSAWPVKWGSTYTPLKNDEQVYPSGIISINATNVSENTNQFSPLFYNNDILKAYAGISISGVPVNTKSLWTRLTSNFMASSWGTGAYGGNHQLKFIILWIALSLSDVKKIHFYTYKNEPLENIEAFVKKHKHKTVGEMYDFLTKLTASDNIFII